MMCCFQTLLSTATGYRHYTEVTLLPERWGSKDAQDIRPQGELKTSKDLQNYPASGPFDLTAGAEIFYAAETYETFFFKIAHSVPGCSDLLRSECWRHTNMLSNPSNADAAVLRKSFGGAVQVDPALTPI